MKIVIEDKGGQEKTGTFYLSVVNGVLSNNVFEYTYSPVDGHFDNACRQLKKRKDLHMREE